MAEIIQRIDKNNAEAPEMRRRIWAIVGASSGNLVEWFDFYVYSFCSLYFAHIFFPSGNTTTQLLQTAGVFAAGFLMRPIVSVVGCLDALPIDAGAKPQC